MNKGKWWKIQFNRHSYTLILGYNLTGNKRKVLRVKYPFSTLLLMIQILTIVYHVVSNVVYTSTKAVWKKDWFSGLANVSTYLNFYKCSLVSRSICSLSLERRWIKVSWLARLGTLCSVSNYISKRWHTLEQVLRLAVTITTLFYHPHKHKHVLWSKGVEDAYRKQDEAEDNTMRKLII